MDELQRALQLNTDMLIAEMEPPYFSHAVFNITRVELEQAREERLDLIWRAEEENMLEKLEQEITMVADSMANKIDHTVFGGRASDAALKKAQDVRWMPVEFFERAEIFKPLLTSHDVKDLKAIMDILSEPLSA